MAIYRKKKLTSPKKVGGPRPARPNRLMSCAKTDEPTELPSGRRRLVCVGSRNLALDGGLYVTTEGTILWNFRLESNPDGCKAGYN